MMRVLKALVELRTFVNCAGRHSGCQGNRPDVSSALHKQQMRSSLCRECLCYIVYLSMFCLEPNEWLVFITEAHVNTFV